MIVSKYNHNVEFMNQHPYHCLTCGHVFVNGDHMHIFGNNTTDKYVNVEDDTDRQQRIYLIDGPHYGGKNESENVLKKQFELFLCDQCFENNIVE